MSNNNKMKGLLKGLRYISQIFDQDEEKEPEMEIGFPTDVKHVAHIGWDGPSSSAGSPSWMNGFKGAPGSSSAPLSAKNRGTEEEDPSVKCVSEDHGGRSPTGSATPNSPKRAPANAARDLQELPKSSRRHLSAGASGSESPTKAKSDKHKQARRSSRGATKDLPDGALKPTRHHHKDPSQEGESPSNLPEIPKKTRRKKSKDSSNNGGGSTSKSSRSRAQAQEVDGGSASGSVTNRDRSSHPSVLSAEENELI